MSPVVAAILPVFLLIFLGWLLKRRAFPGDHFWAPAERLTYFVLFPALIATTLAQADFSRLEILPMAAAIVLAILAMSALILAARRLFAVDGPGLTSVYQGAVRMNTYIGLTVAYGVHGAEGLAAAALAVAAIVPLVNVTCTAMLARYGRGAAPGAAGMARQFATNPLILACLLGGLLNLSGIGLPPVLGPMALILGRAALPLGLLAVGAALDLRAARAAGRVVLQTSALKLAALPLLTWLFLQAFGIEGVAAFVAILFNALPTATSAYILARQLGGDATLMASLITVQTLVALASLPLVLGLLA
ncbi:MAG: AEC family transporter [Tistlia sp.]|uniref:AEC family transporter n=1 Tax=Tistlia sp. TaxID=3057121 RepID=UPI0034A51AB4